MSWIGLALAVREGDAALAGLPGAYPLPGGGEANFTILKEDI